MDFVTPRLETFSARFIRDGRLYKDRQVVVSFLSTDRYQSLLHGRDITYGFPSDYFTPNGAVLHIGDYRKREPRYFGVIRGNSLIPKRRVVAGREEVIMRMLISGFSMIMGDLTLE